MAVPTLLATERSARRHVSPAEGRTWEVFNAGRLNARGHPAAYAIVPGAAGLPHAGPRSPLRRRGAFATSAFHATRFRDGELFAAGRYPNQNGAAEGLSRWIADDESLSGDVVAWYTVGVTHVPRPEEYPIMGATKVGFHLAPVGFFSKNPGLDVSSGR
jgi:primary-amine oxidase